MACCDQEIFIGAVISNPFYGVTPFKKTSLTIHAGLAALFSRLWLRFYEENIPVELFTGLEHYLASSGDFTYMHTCKDSLLAHAQAMVRPGCKVFVHFSDVLSRKPS